MSPSLTSVDRPPTHPPGPNKAVLDHSNLVVQDRGSDCVGEGDGSVDERIRGVLRVESTRGKTVHPRRMCHTKISEIVRVNRSLLW